MITAIQTRTPAYSGIELVGLADYDGESQKIYITSTRLLIAQKTSRAAETKGTFTPGPDLRFDTVDVHCGDSDLGHLFECARVRVRTPDKRIVKALYYSSGAHSCQNATAAHWTVREVLARYGARELCNGLLVEYASFEGTEWTFEVSPEGAGSILWLMFGEPPAQPTIRLR